MDGILLVDKPERLSSFAIVSKVRRVVREKTGVKLKVGHTGTLDPFATGLLILVLGKYTKKAGEFSGMNKTYEAQLELGEVSTTGDPEGKIAQKSTKKPDEEAVEAALALFKGEIEQKPHVYSAIKIGGQRAYKLARKGQTPDLKARKVKVHSIRDVVYDYPRLSFTVSVSSGTYIRSLAEDIGEELGTGAYLSALRRVEVGDFKVKDALKVEQLNYESIRNRLVN